MDSRCYRSQLFSLGRDGACGHSKDIHQGSGCTKCGHAKGNAVDSDIPRQETVWFWLMACRLLEGGGGGGGGGRGKVRGERVIIFNEATY